MRNTHGSPGSSQYKGVIREKPPSHSLLWNNLSCQQWHANYNNMLPSKNNNSNKNILSFSCWWSWLSQFQAKDMRQTLLSSRRPAMVIRWQTGCAHFFSPPTLPLSTLARPFAQLTPSAKYPPVCSSVLIVTEVQTSNYVLPLCTQLSTFK